MISRSQLSVFQKAASPPHSLTVAALIFTGLVLGQAVYAVPENPLELDAAVLLCRKCPEMSGFVRFSLKIELTQHDIAVLGLGLGGGS